MKFEGKVYKSTGSWYVVKSENSYFDCRLKGKLKTKGIKATNPISVGDIVEVVAGEQNEYLIKDIIPRTNYLIRKSTNLSKQHHIVASNLDQVIMIATVDFPYTSLEFIDRISITSEAYNIPFTLIINKSDLFESNPEQIKYYSDIYTSIGIKTIVASAKKNHGIVEIIELLKGRTSLITGHSGVGKSTLINAVDPLLDLKTGSISEQHKTGKHTTTFAEMFDLSFGGEIIDTPGLRAFGLIDFESTNLSHYFIEMVPFLNKCKFHNCVHLHEPGCLVIPKVKEGIIPESRYRSYVNILTQEETIHRENSY